MHQQRAPALLTFLLCLLCLAFARPATAAATGIAVPIGGALKPDNHAVWSRLVELAGGRGARYVVLATASEDPAKSAATIVSALNAHGARAEALVVPVRAQDGTAPATNDPILLAKVAASRGVYFSGGAQARIVDTLIETDGSPTPMLAAIRSLFARGGVVAGSSAGAAVMSSTMFRDPPDNLTILQEGLKAGHDMGRGLGFVGDRLFVDQHFIRRGRLGRMLPLMQQAGYRLGLGVEENSAAVVRGNEVEIIGARGALFADLSDAAHDAAAGAFNIRAARISLLETGDRIDLATRRITPAGWKLAGKKLDPHAPGYQPYFTSDRFYADVLGEGEIAGLMTHLIDGRQQALRGLAFRPPAAERAIGGLAFEFRFYKGPDSVGYFLSRRGEDAYTVLNILLDVKPVQLADPLYRELAPGTKGGTGAN